MRRIAPSLIYIACLIWLALVGFAYPRLSRGLAAAGAEGPFYCHELQSSGGEDDAMIAAFVLFLLPLLLRLALIRRAPGGIEIFLFGCCLVVTFLALWLASLDCAEVFYTAFALPDPVLAFALLALPLAALALLVLRLRS